MYFHVMSSAGVVAAAGAEALHACGRLVAQLGQFGDDLERAANTARPDWEGPHRQRFEDGLALLRQALAAADQLTVDLRVRVDRELQRAYADAVEAASAASPAATGPR